MFSTKFKISLVWLTEKFYSDVSEALFFAFSFHEMENVQKQALPV